MFFFFCCSTIFITIMSYVAVRFFFFRSFLLTTNFSMGWSRFSECKMKNFWVKMERKKKRRKKENYVHSKDWKEEWDEGTAVKRKFFFVETSEWASVKTRNHNFIMAGCVVCVCVCVALNCELRKMPVNILRFQKKKKYT